MKSDRQWMNKHTSDWRCAGRGFRTVRTRVNNVIKTRENIHHYPDDQIHHHQLILSLFHLVPLKHPDFLSHSPCFYSQQPAVTFSHWTLLTCSSLCRDVSMRPDIVSSRPLWFSAPDETSSRHQSVLSEPTRDVRLNSHLSLSAVSAWTHANKTRPRRKPQEQNMFRPSSVCSEPTEASPSNTGEHVLVAVIDPASCDWSDLWLFCC